jgi:hypothetical protein
VGGFELANRRSVDAFINDNPSTFAVTRRTVQGDGAGGRVRGPWLAQGTVRARRVSSNNVGATRTILVPGGDLEDSDFTVIAQEGEDVQRGDRLTDATGVYHVSRVSTDPPWALRAYVSEVKDA